MPIVWPARLRSRLTLALAASLALHLLAALGLYLVGRPVTVVAVKRGEPLFVELPETPDRPPAGNPAERRMGPPAVQTRRTVTLPVSPASRPAPPLPPSQPERVAPPSAAPVVASRPTEPTVSPPAPAPEPPVPPSPPAAASRPEPAPASPPSVPVSPPATASRPEPPLVAPPTPEPATAAPAPAVAAAPTRPAAPSEGVAAAAPAAPAGGSGSPGSAPVVAALPPGAPAPAPQVDIRSALRGGAGGRGDGRGGIEGEPVPLDTPDARYSEYFDRVRRMIKERWAYPCVKNVLTRECEYKTASLVVEFGIAKDGRVPFVTVRQSSGWPIYDDYAVNAIKLAAPFPPIPDAVSRTGMPVLARFNYIVDTSLTNLLR